MASPDDPPAAPLSAPRRSGGPRPQPGDRAVVLVVRGRVTPDRIAELCARVGALLRDPEVDTITCDVSGVVAPDADALDALARMQLTARRLGRSIRLAHVRPEMRELLVLTGLTDVVPPGRTP